MAQRSGFDRLARPYQLLERLTFGTALERCRIAQLPRMLAARRALVLGDGDGRFTAALLAANPHVQVVAVDSSPAMLALLAARVRRLGAASRLTTHTADALDFLNHLSARLPAHSPAHLHPDHPDPLPDRIPDHLPPAEPPPGCFDLLTTHFFLDCLTPVQVRSLAFAATRTLAPGALWVVSEFATPTLWAHSVVYALYFAFRVLADLRVQRLPPFRTILQEAGFTPLAEQTSLRGLLTSAAWALSSSTPTVEGSNREDATQSNHPGPRALPPA